MAFALGLDEHKEGRADFFNRAGRAQGVPEKSAGELVSRGRVAGMSEPDGQELEKARALVAKYAATA